MRWEGRARQGASRTMLLFSFFLLAVLFLMVQSTFFQFFPDWLGNPDLVYILVAFVAYRFDWIRGGLLVFSFGWMMDVVSGTFLGTYTLIYLTVFPLLKLLTQKNPLKEAAYQVPFVGGSYFVMQFCLYSFFSLIQPDSLPEWFWGRVLQESIILTFATIPTFLFCNSLFEFISRKRTLGTRLARRSRSGNQFRS